MPGKFKAAVLPIAMFIVASLFYWYEFLLRVLPSPMYAQLMLEYDIDATKLGYLFSSYFLSYAFLQLLAGLWTDRLGPRRLLTIAVLLCAFSTLIFAHTSSFVLVCLARFFIGAGSAFAFVSCMKIVNIWFKPSVFPVLSGLTLTIGSLGAVSGVAYVSIALQSLAWRELSAYLGYFGIVLAVLTWLLIRDEKKVGDGDSSKQKSDKTSDKSFVECLQDVLHSRQCWIVALYGSLTTAPTDAIGGLWAVPYLEQVHGLSNELASSAASKLFVGMAVGSPLLAFLSNYFNNRKYIMYMSSIMASICLFMFCLMPSISYISASLLCFFAGVFGAYVMCFVVINDISDAKHIATSVGFVNMVCMLGSVLLSAAMGIGMDLVSSYLGLQVTGRIYSQVVYQLVLSTAPLLYALSALIVIPSIKESFDKDKYNQ